MAFELAWKTLKDYLEADGFQIQGPRDVLKQAFQPGILKDGHVWMEALEDRNLTTQTYNEETSLKVDRLIREKYFPAISERHKALKTKV